ncbi:MAG: DUF2807 domain-containing protein, partial [Pseudomonadales bacterium]|nr:DUF2807 domain-containing protein [Pseudomonadales bacterium]
LTFYCFILGFSTMTALATTKNYDTDIGSFNAIYFSGIATIHISQGEIGSLSMRGSENNLSDISVEVRVGVLHIDTHDKLGAYIDSNLEDLEIKLVVVDLAEISLKGSANIFVSSLDVKSLSLHVSGASELDVRVFGVGEVSYLGSPKITQSVRGMGEIRQIRI